MKEQSEKAKIFIELSQRKKTLEVSLWMDTIQQSNQTLKNQGDKILSCTLEHEEIESQIQEFETNIQQAFLDMQNSLISIDNMRREKERFESEISQSTSQVAVFENDIEHNKQSIVRIQSEIDNHSKDFATVNLEISEKDKQLEDTRIKQKTIHNLVEDTQKQMLEMSLQADTLTSREKDLSSRLNQLLLQQTQANMGISSTEEMIQDLTQTIAKNEIGLLETEKEIDAYQRELQETTSFLQELDEKAEVLKNTYSGHKIKLDNRSQKLNAMKQECENIDLEIREKVQKTKLLEGMEQSLDGFAFSVKEIIKKHKNGRLQGIYGTVSQIIEVKNEYSTAIETALGGAMQNIVVASELEAKAAIRTLKEDRLGRATFLPLTTITGATLHVAGLEQYAGFIDIASNLVSYDQKYKGIISSLLAKVVIVEDIDTAVIVAQKNNYKFKIVTLDGQVVNPGGSFTGGSKNKGQSFLSRKNDITTLRFEIEKRTHELAENKIAMAQVSADALKIEAEFTALASEMTTLNEDKIRTTGECKRIEQMLLHSTQLVSNMSVELKSKHAKHAQMAQTQEMHTKALNGLEVDISNCSKGMIDLQESNQSAVNLKTVLSDELAAVTMSNIVYQKDIESLSQSILALTQRKETTNNMSGQLRAQVDLLEINNHNLAQDIQQIMMTINQKREAIIEFGKDIEKMLASRQEFEGKTTTLRKNQRDVSEIKEKISADIARLEEKKSQIQNAYDVVIAKLWDEYELTRSEAQSIAVPLENPQKATANLNAIRIKIRGLGSVNVAAIEEYQEVNQRYKFLNSQVKDAEKSRNELLKLIQDLTQQMQDIFAENFQKINYHFNKIFIDLFGGGHAELQLSEPDNLLESGVEILVEPPGKIIKNLASLSGGEQAFIAIAIYFAILKVRPAPFCIMDEIEAALDDVNVDKYAAYLQSMCAKTQFILITHRRGSMEVADVLYGVTMQDEGVSKLLELNVTEIEDKLRLNV